MRLFFLILIEMGLLWAQSENRAFDCNKIFEQRKEELVLRLEQIDAQVQALESLREASEALLGQKESALFAREANVTTALAQIEAVKSAIEGVKNENAQILEAIKKARSDKIAEVYTKMKPAASAQVLSELPLDEAVKIMHALSPKVISTIFAKMEPKKASQLTSLLNRQDDIKSLPQ